MKKFREMASLLVAMLMVFSGMVSADTGSGRKALQDENISVTIPIGTYTIKSTTDGHEIAVENFGSLLIPGKPKLPSKIFAIAIPPGAEVVEVSFEAGEGIVLPGTYEIAPAPLPRVIDQEDPLLYEQDRKRYQKNYESVYGSDDRYPENAAELVRTAGFRKYNLVDIRVTPFAYRPLSGQLTYYSEVTLHISYAFPEGFSAGDVMIDNLTRMEQTAEEFIFNYDQSSEWYTGGGSDKGLHDFVIITLESLTSSVTPLVDWETFKGRTVEVVTTSWISSNYTGYDLAEQMRNFLRDKYPSEVWGIEDVLLVGHYDDVPMRRTAQDLGYGQPETDLYFAELSLPDSLSWDADKDHQYGENSDPIDFYSEVNVGRIPWSEPATVLGICEKSVAYEQNNDPSFKKNILLLGAYFWADTDNAVMMEYKVNTNLHPWMSEWTMTRMYEKNSSYWSSYDCDYPLLNSNVMTVWPAGSYAYVNWAGHGSPTSCHIYGLGAPAFISSSDCPSLNDDYPAIIFADACSNSDTDYPNIGRAMLGQGAVGFVGATKVAYGCPGWNDPYDGSSQSLDYFFTTCVTSGEYSQGAALQWALREMYVNGLWDSNKYEMFEWGALWGNPNIQMVPSALQIILPDGTPEAIEPGVPTMITVQIKEGIDTYVPGSGMLRYRYDGGKYLTSPLVSLGGDLYEATLPAANCDDIPEYYFSAAGDSVGTIHSPFDAPLSVYTSLVSQLFTLYTEDLMADPGWTTEGDWGYGQPTGGGGAYGGPDPTSGYTGNDVYGYNLNGDYPNNMPQRHLTSPAIDCSGYSQVRLKFWRWLGVERSAYDHAYIRASTDGSNWTTVWENSSEIADYSWTLMNINISAVADSQPVVYLRWTMGTSDGGWTYCGWNIDDIQISGYRCEPVYLCGDTDGNTEVNVADVIFLIDYIFAGGAVPDPLLAGDVDCDQLVNISDAVYLIVYIFGGGPVPCAGCP